MFKKIAIAATLAILSWAARAADQPYFYAGGDLGSTKVDSSDRETSYGAFVGYQFNQHIAIEGAYRRLAKFDYQGGSGKYDQVAVSAVGTLPLSNGFSVFGRLGANYLSADNSYVGGLTRKVSDTKVLYGAGVSYAFSPTISGRLEVQRPESDVTNISAGIAFRF